MIIIIRAVLLLLLYFVIGEVLARFLLNSPSVVISDEELGWIWQPGRELFHTKEGWGRNRINPLGLNDIDPSQHPYEKNILILGDSFTEALQVSQSANFTSLTEHALHCANIINAGRAGMALTHLLPMANRLANKTEIFSIVLVLNNWDLFDTLTNSGSLEFDNTGQIVSIKLGFRQPHIARQKADLLFRNSALASYLLERAKTLFSRPVKAENIGEVAIDDNVRESVAVETFSKIADFVVSELQNIAPVSILYIPQLDYDYDGVSRITEDSAAFEETLLKITGRHSVDFLSSTIWLQSSYMENKTPPVGFHNSRLFQGHLNHSGHRAVGKALTKLLSNACQNTEERVGD